MQRKEFRYYFLFTFIFISLHSDFAQRPMHKIICFCLLQLGTHKRAKNKRSFLERLQMAEAKAAQLKQSKKKKSKK